MSILENLMRRCWMVQVSSGMRVGDIKRNGGGYQHLTKGQDSDACRLICSRERPVSSGQRG